MLGCPKVSYPPCQTALHANPQLSTPPTDSPVGPSSDELATWSQRPDGGIDIMHRFPIKQVAWHARGDYFSTVAPTGNTQVRVRLGVQRRIQMGAGARGLGCRGELFRWGERVCRLVRVRGWLQGYGERGFLWAALLVGRGQCRGCVRS